MDELHVGERCGARVRNRIPFAFKPVGLVHELASRSSGSTEVSLCHGMLDGDQVILGRYHVLVAQANVRFGRKRTYRTSHPPTASSTAVLLNPAAQKSSSEANSPWAESIRLRPSVPCINGARI